MTTTAIAVAVATCGRPDALARCLDAVLGGSVQPSELVVVDQDTRSATAVVATRQPVRHLAQERRGLSASRNLAIESTSAPVVAFTDDDCVPDTGWLEALAAAFAGDERLAAVSGRMLPLGPAVPGRFAVATRDSTERLLLAGRPAPWSAGTGGNLAVRRGWLEAVRGFDERLGAGSPGLAGEDIDLLDRLLRAGGHVLFEPDAVVRHERQPQERRRTTRRTYGHGVGASCGLALRRRDPYGAVHLLRWLGLRTRLLVRAAASRRATGVAEELLVLAGTARGLGYGLRAR